jgi:hypothetical protein
VIGGYAADQATMFRVCAEGPMRPMDATASAVAADPVVVRGFCLCCFMWIRRG